MTIENQSGLYTGQGGPGPWGHTPHSIWREDEAREVDEEDDNTYLCQVFQQKGDITMLYTEPLFVRKLLA